MAAVACAALLYGDAVVPSPAPALQRSTLRPCAADPESERAVAIEKFLEAPISQVEPMDRYFKGLANFDTHQSVKGLQFDHVMVIRDDSEARGFSFKYEDLFGGKAAGEKIVETTRRLFYVTCSRAKKTLALVAHTADPARIEKFVLQEGWFKNEEIITDLNSL